MNNSIEIMMIDLFAISAGFWLMYGLYIVIRTMKFIVKRYEKETDLLDTAFFINHVPFARYFPDFFSSAIYAGHLMMCLWGWRYFQSKKVFKDISDPEYITRHFTKNEVNIVKRNGICFLILFTHIIAYYIFKLIWPEVFN